MKTAIRITLAMLILISSTGYCITITVTSSDSGKNVATACVLRDAITAANTHVPVGGCAAGSPAGTNIIVLPSNGLISLTVPDNVDPNYGPNGLPVVTASLEIDGNNTVIERSAALVCNRDRTLDPSEFRILLVEASLDLRNVTLRGGCSDGSGTTSGGGLLSTGPISITHSTIAGNYASSGGGGIASINNDVSIEYSTIAGNDGDSLGASAFFGILLDNSNVNTTIFNSTISGNAAGTLPVVFGKGSLRVESSTIAHNDGFGIYYRNSNNVPNSIVIKNAIVSDNDTANCELPNDATLLIQGANLSSDDSCTGFSLPNTPSRLAPLGNYGGPTQTHSPLSGSPTIDAVSNCSTIDGVNIIDDQRGASRPMDGDRDNVSKCDIGAVEYDGDLVFLNGFE